MRFTHKIFYKDMVSLLPQTLNDICDHAKEQFPDECCGIILHADSQEFVRPCRNIQNDMHKDDPDAYPRDARTAYIMHPDDLIAIHKEVETQHRQIKAFYHSHPNHEAYFSEKDKSDAMVWGEPAYPGVAYLVISIYEDTIRVVKAFKWNEDTSDFIEVPVQTTPLGAMPMTALKVRLTIPQEKITEPIIYNIGQHFRVVTNIRRANVTEESGWVMLEIHGPSDEIERAIDYLKNINVQVEPVEGDVVQ
jgi:proteasome lid subunit RPN8/RPN11